MLQRLMRIDRRLIYLAIAAVVAAPFVFNWTLPLGSASPRTRAVYRHIEALPPRSAVMICFDYGPASMPELHPMGIALARHAFSRKLRVIGLTLGPEGLIMAQNALSAAAKDYGAREGEDWVNLGYKPGFISVILGMGTDIPKVFRTDHRGVPIAELRAMDGIRTYADLGLVVELTASPAINDWVVFAQSRFHAKLAGGVTAVMATDMYPYLQAGQLIGLLNGLKGAAEYEALIRHPGLASLGMTSQSFAHVAILVFVVLGNIGYFATRRRRR